MAKSPGQLTVAKSDAAADTIAAAIWDFVSSMDVGSARDASTQRMLRKHAEEIVELHDTLKVETVLSTPKQVQSNGHYAQEPAYSNEG